MRRWMTIDPGLSGTGWAVFEGKKLLCWGIERSQATHWTSKAKTIINKLSWVENEFGPKKIFCEWPTFQNTVAINVHSIPKLAYLIGGMCNWFINVELIKVSSWRGSIPKELVWKRAEKFFNKKGFFSHSGDAVGIGQYVIENNLW